MYMHEHTDAPRQQREEPGALLVSEARAGLQPLSLVPEEADGADLCVVRVCVYVGGTGSGAYRQGSLEWRWML